MNLTDMMVFVRLQADADVEDAPQATLEVYARAAYNDIRRRVHMWPSLRVNVTLTTVAGQDEYPFTDFVGGEMEYIQTLVGNNDVVDFIPFHELLLLQEGQATVQSTLDATYYSISNQTLVFWPTPSEITTYSVRGVRTFADWPVDTVTESDLPREFDEAICWYMLSKYYASQEDLELSERYMADYERQVNRFIASSIRTSAMTNRPKILGGRRRTGMLYETWVRRNVEGVVL